MNPTLLYKFISIPSTTSNINHHPHDKTYINIIDKIVKYHLQSRLIQQAFNMLFIGTLMNHKQYKIIMIDLFISEYISAFDIFYFKYYFVAVNT
jgi:uncharacterized membrane protein